MSVMLERRPHTRGDCADGPRPCPWISCRYHLGNLESYGKLTLRRANMSETCALDVADGGAHGLRETGRLMGLSRQTVLDIERMALGKVRGALAELGICDVDSPCR